MCPHTPTNGHPDTGNPGEDEPGNIVPFTRAGVTVERIDTEPMTSDEYRLAVTALAALINQWNHADENPPHSGENAA